MSVCLCSFLISWLITVQYLYPMYSSYFQHIVYKWYLTKLRVKMCLVKNKLYWENSLHQRIARWQALLSKVSLMCLFLTTSPTFFQWLTLHFFNQEKLSCSFSFLMCLLLLRIYICWERHFPQGYHTWSREKCWQTQANASLWSIVFAFSDDLWTIIWIWKHTVLSERGIVSFRKNRIPLSFLLITY